MVELVQLLASGPSDVQRRMWSAVTVAGVAGPALVAALGDPHRWQLPYTEAEVGAALEHIHPCAYLETIVRPCRGRARMGCRLRPNQ
jgi:hypothetical protein